MIAKSKKSETILTIQFFFKTKILFMQHAFKKLYYKIFNFYYKIFFLKFEKIIYRTMKLSYERFSHISDRDEIKFCSFDTKILLLKFSNIGLFKMTKFAEFLNRFIIFLNEINSSIW